MGLRRWLVAGQVAIALALVSGALLLLQSVRSLRAVDPGFSVENRLVLQVSLNTRKYASGEKRIDYFDPGWRPSQALGDTSPLVGPKASIEVGGGLEIECLRVNARGHLGQKSGRGFHNYPRDK